MVEVGTKVRELEVSMLDMKAQMERRLTQLAEEIPGRL
jgi:hypothetical protein